MNTVYNILFAVVCALLVLAAGLAVAGLIKLTVKAFYRSKRDSFATKHRHAVFIALQDQLTINLSTTYDHHARSILATALLKLRTMYSETKHSEDMIVHVLTAWRDASRAELLNRRERSNGQAQG